MQGTLQGGCWCLLGTCTHHNYIFKQYSVATHVKLEANSSIEYFNDNDETVLQGETQYKHAE